MISYISERSFALSVVMVGVLLSLATTARAAERHYAAHGTAQFISANDFVGTGTATHLGAYEEEGSADFFPTANPAVFRVEASSTYTASNGDQLHAVITGEIDFSTGRISASVTYDGGTGRFANATGSATFVGQMYQDGSIDADVVGTINFGGR